MRSRKSIILLSLIGCLIFLTGLTTGVFLQKEHYPYIIKSYISPPFESLSNLGNMKNPEALLLRTRKFQRGSYIIDRKIIPINQVALVLIDVWREHPERENKNIREKIVPLLQAARKADLLIIHAPHGRTIHPLAKPLPGEAILNDYDANTVFNQLKHKGIKTLIYAGYATNMCVTFTRPISIVNAYKRGFKIILVRDATVAIESPNSLNGEWARKMTAFLVELNWGQTTTVKDFKEAFVTKGIG